MTRAQLSGLTSLPVPAGEYEPGPPDRQASGCLQPYPGIGPGDHHNLESCSNSILIAGTLLIAGNLNK